MLNTPYKLEELGLDLGQKSPVNIDGLIQRRLPLDANGELRVEISQVLSRALLTQGVLSPERGKKSENIVEVPFREDLLPGWRLSIVNEAVQGPICLLEGAGRIAEDTFNGNPIFTLTRTGLAVGSGGFQIPRSEVWVVASSDFYFQNPGFGK